MKDLKPRSAIIEVLACLLAAWLVAPASAGDGVTDLAIDPATGVTISVPGSYRVVRDVTMSGASSAIVVNANDVTIDLGGHTLTGIGGAGSVSGINATNDTGVTVLNGRVKGFSGWGVNCAAKARITGVTAEGNNTGGGFGGILAGADSVVINCMAIANNPASTGTTHGIRVGTGCSVLDSIANDNTAAGTGIAYGIYAINNCLIRGNTCDNNDSSATGGTGSAYGIRVDTHCRVLDNICTNQTEGPDDAGTAAGINSIGEGNFISGNNCNSNAASGAGAAAGIWVSGAECRIERNHCAQNAGGTSSIGAGIYVNGAGTMVEQNTCNSNAGGGSSLAGILVSALGDECTIVSNRTRGNGSFGIRLLTGSTGGFFGLNFTLDTHVDDGTNTEGTGALNNWP